MYIEGNTNALFQKTATSKAITLLETEWMIASITWLGIQTLSLKNA
jgi:hypothetical protein